MANEKVSQIDVEEVIDAVTPDEAVDTDTQEQPTKVAEEKKFLNKLGDKIAVYRPVIKKAAVTTIKIVGFAGAVLLAKSLYDASKEDDVIDADFNEIDDQPLIAENYGEEIEVSDEESVE